MNKREDFSTTGCVLLVLVSFVLLLLIPLGVWGFRVATAEWRGRGDAHIQLNSAEFRIAAYDHFHDLCASIQGNEGQIDALQAQLQDAESERSRDLIRASLAGVIGGRKQAIARYNEDANKEYTVGQFRDSDLPYHLEPFDYPDPNGRTTQCSYQ